MTEVLNSEVGMRKSDNFILHFAIYPLPSFYTSLPLRPYAMDRTPQALRLLPSIFCLCPMLIDLCTLHFASNAVRHALCALSQLSA